MSLGDVTINASYKAKQWHEFSNLVWRLFKVVKQDLKCLYPAYNIGKFWKKESGSYNLSFFCNYSYQYSRNWGPLNRRLFCFVFFFTPSQKESKKAIMYQKLDRHLQCAINFTKFLRNYQTIVALSGWTSCWMTMSNWNIFQKRLSWVVKKVPITYDCFKWIPKRIARVQLPAAKELRLARL